MAMAQTAFRTRPALFRHRTAAANETKSAEMPLFQAFLRPSSAKVTDGHCIKDTTTIDPACGSGSLLLKAEKVLGKHAIRNGFFGQEINITTYNLCRINMFLHDVGFDKFDIACEDTLISPQHQVWGRCHRFPYQ